LPDFADDGVAVTLIICISTPVQVLLLAPMARQTGTSAADYLCLTLPHKSDVVVGSTASATGWLPCCGSVVVAAPIGEETLFRGFLFRGWHRSPRDAWPAIIVTALLWALIHLQYDIYLIAQVFVYGLVLGWFRWVAGSTTLTMLLHGLVNFEGMLETFMTFHN
jgi:membrane protease YdiL (CAAX protease family)